MHEIVLFHLTEVDVDRIFFLGQYLTLFLADEILFKHGDLSP